MVYVWPCINRPISWCCCGCKWALFYDEKNSFSRAQESFGGFGLLYASAPCFFLPVKASSLNLFSLDNNIHGCSWKGLTDILEGIVTRFHRALGATIDWRFMDFCSSRGWSPLRLQIEHCFLESTRTDWLIDRLTDWLSLGLIESYALFPWIGMDWLIDW